MLVFFSLFAPPPAPPRQAFFVYMFSASCAYVSRLPQAQDHTVRFQKEQADPGGGGGRRTGNAGHQKTECSFQPLRLDNAPIYPVCLA